MGPITPHRLNGWLWLAWAVYWFLAAANTNKTKYSEQPWQKLAHILPLYFGFFLIFHDRQYAFIYHRLYDNNLADEIGTLITLAGLAISVWARVHLGKYWSGVITLKEGHKLIRTGPYRFVRHPIYTGMITGAIGSALTASTADAWIGIAIIIASLVMKSRWEEALLTTEFGDEYSQFKRDVPAIFPLFY